MTYKYLFVYGTLKRGSDNPISNLLELYSTVLCRGSYPGQLYLIDNYPAAVYDVNSRTRVYGEVLILNNASQIMKELDDYEGIGSKYQNPNEFKRIAIKIDCDDNKARICWVYVYNRSTEGLSNISNGKFLNDYRL